MGSVDGGGSKLWGGRFSGQINPLMNKFNESLSMDKRMWKEDIQGSQAYAKALAKIGIITEEEATNICVGLIKVGQEWEKGTFEICSGDEDIHTANERRLTEIIGPLGGKLHTGRSRNDQVATDTRLYLLSQIKMIKQYLIQLINCTCDVSEEKRQVLMPGFTHLQSAQSVRFSHWLMSHCSSWQRDLQRLNDLVPRVAMLPLGSGALAGNPFLVDRQFLAQELGFQGVCPNSMDAVSDRDFVCEFVFFVCMHLMHLSRWSEDVIIYSSGPFGFVQCSDAYATGSSLMPQKKNPDALELLRGKAGVMIGNLTGALAVIKGTPQTYNKDFQEVWQIMYDSIDTISDCIQIATGIIATIKLNDQKMMQQLSGDMLATDLAEYLVRKGVPFRETHHISGAAVKLAEERNCQLTDLSVADLKQINQLFEEDVSDVWDFQKSVERRDSDGGTSERSLLQQIEKMREFINKQ